MFILMLSGKVKLSMASCQTIKHTSLIGKSPQNSGVSDQTCNWTRTITVRLPEGTKVTLMQKLKVKIDGKKVPLPYIKLGSLSIMKDGYRVVLRTNDGKKKNIQKARLSHHGIKLFNVKYHRRYVHILRQNYKAFGDFCSQTKNESHNLPLFFIHASPL